ncbi:MAG: CPBP family intramembrane metalloprotease [Thermoleophilaceae bacterium]|nr:CPBP family intramembrane metalloprotease [Thermoleophilaceae bacterium]
MARPTKFFKASIRQILFDAFGRLRSGWRFLVFLFLFLIFSTAGGAAVYVLIVNVPIGFDKKSVLFFLLGNLVSFLWAVLIGWFCGKFLEGLPFRALGFWFTENWLKDLLSGLALGAVAMLLAALITIIFGGLSFQFNQTVPASAVFFTLGVSLLVFIIGAAFEEVLFRGYVLQTFSRSGLAWFAIVLTSVFFAIGHRNNPNAGYISLINTLLAGLWFSAAYLKTRTLWLAFGLHLMWNWVQGAILGIEVSGIKELTTAPLFREVDAGPAWLTGGDYGIEGSVGCTIALVFSIVLIWFLPIFKPTEEMLLLTSEKKRADARG